MTNKSIRALFAAAAVTASTGAFAQATRTNASPVFTGVYNFRDVGGYRTADGHIVKSGILYRSGTLGDMTPSDRDVLLSLGIHSEVDLRCPDEIADMPSRWGSARMTVSRPFLELCDFHSGVTEVGEGYAEAASLGATGLGKTFRDISQSRDGTLMHCTGGADRTGLSIAILFRILGVSEDQIEKEYLLTNAYWGSAEGLRHADRILKGPPPPGFPGMKATAIRVMFAAIDRKYRSFDRYVTDGLKLSPRDILAIRRRFLEA